MYPISPEKIIELKRKANDIRKTIVEMLIEAKSGHTAGPLDMADIFTALYFHLLKHNPQKPDWTERDRLVLSNGHICPVLYATMAHAGYFPVAETLTLRKFKSRLQGHPHRDFLPSLETSSGPLGSGLSQAVGMALADKTKFIYCLTSDGELDCGNTWEAVMLAGKNKLNNLIVIVDRNKIQIDGFTEDIMPLEPLRQKWEAFNFNIIEIDGHNFEQIIVGVESAKTVLDKPTVILAHTIPSKGIPEFEGKFEWHGKPPTTPEEITTARTALNEIEKQLK